MLGPEFVEMSGKLYLDLLLWRLHKPINHSQTRLDVPLVKHSYACSCAQHPLVLVLVHPAVVVLPNQHEFIGSESSIDKTVDKAVGQVIPRTVDGQDSSPGVVQM